MNINEKAFSKDDAYKTLDTVNMWITNCDTKASIFVASISIIGSMVVSSKLFDIIINVIMASFNFEDPLMFLFNILLWSSLVAILVGLFFLIKVILPQIFTFYYKGNGEKKSLILLCFMVLLLKKL